MAKKLKPKQTIHHYFDPPIQSRPELLPLHDPNWSWDQFEAFCRDFVANRPGVVQCHHYGKQGSRQRGIDLYADFENGTRWTFQCKQRKDFRQTNEEETIAKHSYQADHHVIMVSTELGSEARDACAKHPGWEIWDVRDISNEVAALRSSDPDTARRLVEDHFGKDWRSAFLGLGGLPTFLSPYDFFRGFLNPKHIFNHTFSLVGRKAHLDALDNFVMGEEHRIALIRGQGGIGKSKLLHSFSESFAQRHLGFVLRFVPDGVPITPGCSDELPSSPLMVVIDDAHRRDRDELGVLFAIARQREKPLKLILSMRPNGFDAVYSRLIHAGYSSCQIAPVIALQKLSRSQVRELAADVLGKDHHGLVDRLAEASKDCPLVTVVGGRLLVERAVAPELLERQTEFQDEALSRFRDEIVGRLSDQIDTKLCLGLLRLVAAVMPFDPSDNESAIAAAEFLGTDQSDIVEAVGYLQEMGVMYRRGRSLRITPDVLADHILHNACIIQGRQTDYIRRVFDKFGEICPAQLLRNLAELDWRVNTITEKCKADLLAEVWTWIFNDFKNADSSGRLRILKTLSDFAYYQPKRTLEIVDFAARNPIVETEGHNQPYRTRHIHVLAKLPDLLNLVCYSLEYLPRACELLWKLACDDDRPRSTEPGALKVLEDLARYSPDKLAIFNDAILVCIERWADSPNTVRHFAMLCDILDPFLEKTGHTSYRDGNRILFKQFHVSENNTRLYRDRVINLLERFLESEDLKLVLRALRSLAKILTNPLPQFNLIVGAEIIQIWEPEQLRTLDILDQFISKNRFAVATLRAIGDVRWVVQYNWSTKVKERAAAVLNAFVPDFDFRLTELLLGGHRYLVNEPAFDGDVVTSMAKKQESLKESSLSTWNDIIRQWPDPERGRDLLSEFLDPIRLDSVYNLPSTFFNTVAEAHLDYAYKLCDSILKQPQCTLAHYFGFIATPIRHYAPAKGLDLLRRALASEHTVLCLGVSSVYYHHGWVDSACDEDERLIEKLLAHPDLNVRVNAIGALCNLGKARHEVAMRLALGADLDGNVYLAEELFRRFSMGIGVRVEELHDQEIDCLIEKLFKIESLEGYEVNNFLVLASKRRPASVIRMLLRRIDTFGRDYTGKVQALPSIGFNSKLEGLPQDSGYQDLLREVRDRMIAPGPSNRSLIAGLFKEITLDFSTDCLSVLGEWLESSDESRIFAISLLLMEAPHDYIFVQSSFVVKVLNIAHSLGDECYRHVSANLRNPSITRGKSGIPGEAFPEDLALKEQASTMAKACCPGSPQWEFYNSLVEHSKDMIRFSLRDSEFELDG